jgi:hypothetical protein
MKRVSAEHESLTSVHHGSSALRRLLLLLFFFLYL